MDEADGWLLGFALAAMGMSVILLCHAVRALQQDVALLRITAAVPEIERHD